MTPSSVRSFNLVVSGVVIHSLLVLTVLGALTSPSYDSTSPPLWTRLTTSNLSSHGGSL